MKENALVVRCMWRLACGEGWHPFINFFFFFPHKVINLMLKMDCMWELCGMIVLGKFCAGKMNEN